MSRPVNHFRHSFLVANNDTTMITRDGTRAENSSTTQLEDLDLDELA